MFILIDAIYSIGSIDRINHINPGVINCSALQLKDNSNDPTNSGITFWGFKEGFSILLEFANILQGLFQYINKITLRVITSNSPWVKVLPFEIVGVIIIYPVKKGINILICHLEQEKMSIS